MGLTLEITLDRKTGKTISREIVGECDVDYSGFARYLVQKHFSNNEADKKDREAVG